MKTYLGNDAPLPGNDAKPNVVDVVVHLGRTRRFGGWADPDWTVLHHSTLTALLYAQHYGGQGAIHALLHDAHEYVLGDIPTPVKDALGREALGKVERELDGRIYGELSVPAPTDLQRRRVKECDLAALIVEAYYFGGSTGVFETIGAETWRFLDDETRRGVRYIIISSCGEVYSAMLVSEAYSLKDQP